MPVEPIPVQRLNDLKSATLRVIQAYRGLPMLNMNDLKIRSIRDVNDEYELEGDYSARTPFGATIEKGTFDIKLTKPDLNVVLGGVRISPGQNVPVFQ